MQWPWKKKGKKVKEELGLLNESRHQEFSMPGLLSFIGFLIFGGLFSLLSVVLIPLVLIYSLYISLQNRCRNFWIPMC